MEHDPKTCGCSYLGCDMWSCGHVDNQPDEPPPVCARCGQPYTWNPAVDAFEHSDPCNGPEPTTE